MNPPKTDGGVALVSRRRIRPCEFRRHWQLAASGTPAAALVFRQIIDLDEFLAMGNDLTQASSGPA